MTQSRLGHSHRAREVTAYPARSESMTMRRGFITVWTRAPARALVWKTMFNGRFRRVLVLIVWCPSQLSFPPFP